ncbi:hypothetical protein CFR74_14880 [Novacetimonas hansenii]|nr:hypothetical protein CFR74_14880 [Novacetimonas hansenii]
MWDYPDMVDVTKEGRVKISPELDQEIRARIQRIRQKKAKQATQSTKDVASKGRFWPSCFDPTVQ